jgi:hypothetical protein
MCDRQYNEPTLFCEKDIRGRDRREWCAVESRIRLETALGMNDVSLLTATVATVERVFSEKSFHEDFLRIFSRKGVRDGRRGSP